MTEQTNDTTQSQSSEGEQAQQSATVTDLGNADAAQSTDTAASQSPSDTSGSQPTSTATSDSASSAASTVTQSQVEAGAGVTVSVPAVQSTAALGNASLSQAEVNQQVTDKLAPQAAQFSTPVTNASPAIGQLEETSKKVGAQAKGVLEVIKTYMSEMAPKKPLSQEAQCRHQVALFRALTLTINVLEEDFRPTWQAILKVFHEHRDGVFHERYVFRHFANMALSSEERTTFMALLNLIKLIADPKARKAALRQVDLERSLEVGITEEGRNRIRSFLNV